VTCLCPTYGRFERLRDAIACFLLQDYPNKRLLVLNDAPVPLVLEPSPRLCVSVVNSVKRFETLGHKRQALLEMADTSLVAHWDDDDLYLPWHISQCVHAMDSINHEPGYWTAKAMILNENVMRQVRMVKPRGAWWALGPNLPALPSGEGRGKGSFSIKGPCHNVFEGQVVFDREEALRLGGYPPKVSGQARALIEKFQEAGKFLRFDPWPYISYVYRWGDGLHHISGSGDTHDNHKAFAARNTDFGDGEPLIPRNAHLRTWAIQRLGPIWTCLIEGLRSGPVAAGKLLASDLERIDQSIRSYL